MPVEKQAILSAPKTPGVYIFRQGHTALYIGKAARLKKRLASYFRTRVATKVAALRAEADRVEWHETHSEIEALIREAALIKEHLPKFNMLMRDDKNYFYVAITQEEFPRVFLTHQPSDLTARHNRKQKIHSYRFIGPFTHGGMLKNTLKILRRAFPYCTCAQTHKRTCLNSQIGRCPGYCCGADAAPDQQQQIIYRDHIRALKKILSGRRCTLLRDLKRAMRTASEDARYENAAHLRDQIQCLNHIFAHRAVLTPSLNAPQFRWHKIEKTIQRACQRTARPITRVEGYDIANISGTDATGSMVVFIAGKAAKSEYRKFKIRTVAGANDIAMHREVIRRRLLHKEWPLPDLMLIDGGKPQLHAADAAATAFFSNAQDRPFVIAALAKRNEELYTEMRALPLPLASLPQEVMFFFQRVRDESHRFAQAYHHTLRQKALKNSL